MGLLDTISCNEQNSEDAEKVINATKSILRSKTGETEK
jgi:hypothetical protein